MKHKIIMILSVILSCLVAGIVYTYNNPSQSLISVTHAGNAGGGSSGGTGGVGSWWAAHSNDTITAGVPSQAWKTFIAHSSYYKSMTQVQYAAHMSWNYIDTCYHAHTIWWYAQNRYGEWSNEGSTHGSITTGVNFGAPPFAHDWSLYNWAYYNLPGFRTGKITLVCSYTNTITPPPPKTPPKRTPTTPPPTPPKRTPTTPPPTPPKRTPTTPPPTPPKRTPTTPPPTPTPTPTPPPTTPTPPPTEPKWTTYSWTNSGGVSLNLDLDGVYASQTKLTPESLTDLTGSESSKWNATHEEQFSAPEENQWGHFVDGLNDYFVVYGGTTDGQGDLDRLKEKSDRLQQGDYVAHPNITMSPENRLAFAKGGVYTVSELRKKAHVHYEAFQRWTVQCTAHLKDDIVQYTTCGPKEYETTILYPDKQLDSSFSPYSFWQMINVRCNASGLDKVKANVPGFVEDSYANGKGSSSGHTKTYYTNDTNFADRPLGNPGQSGVLAQTVSKEFYQGTGSCDGNGTNVVPPDNDYALDCSSVNQARGTNDSYNNKRKNGDPTVKDKAGNDKYGAQTTQGAYSKTETSSDAFSFYRDNKQNRVRLDLWYPVANATNSGITANGDKQPYLTRMLLITAANSNGVFPDGTPTGDNFGIRLNENDSDVINGVGDNTVQEKDIDGEQTSFWTHANWTSENDTTEVKNGKEIDTNNNKAQKLNADWSYTPTVKNNVLGTVSGDGADANPTKTVDESNIIATCAIHMNTTDNTNDNLSVVNSLFDVGRGSLTKADTRENHYLKMSFVRAVGDAQ